VITAITSLRLPPARPEPGRTPAAKDARADAEARRPGAEKNQRAENQRAETTRADGKELDAAAQQQVAELQRIDRAVRAHEAAHQAAAGGLGGGASFSYTTGPDGRRYATGGEVAIDTGAERTPQATIAKMMRVRAAALAPGDPSSQDLAVASRAAQVEMQARAELMRPAENDLPRRQQAARQAYGG
jgi:hypothetical protein